MKMNIDRQMKTEHRNRIIRRILYIIFAVFAFVIITTIRTSLPMPLLLIPIAICAAAFEHDSPIYCSLFGCICGLLLDAAMGTLISFNGIILTFCSMMTSLIFLFWFRRQLFNFLLLNIAVSLIQGALHYLFFFLLWGYDPEHTVLREIFLPELILTNLAGIAVYGVFRLTERFFGTVREHYIEENAA